VVTITQPLTKTSMMVFSSQPIAGPGETKHRRKYGQPDEEHQKPHHLELPRDPIASKLLSSKRFYWRPR
jgi:hypothetical protein